MSGILDSVDSSHLEQSVPYEWTWTTVGGQDLIVHDNPNGLIKAYVVSAVSRNVRIFAGADATLWDGSVVDAVYEPEYNTVLFQHAYAGKLGRRCVSEWLDEPAARLSTLPTDFSPGRSAGGDGP
jgi:hypothetical protein